ncbi:MAG: hypothetical protein WBQ09_17030 [Terriglobales bacterium]
MKRRLMAVAALLAFLWSAGCSSEPAKPAQAEKPQPKPTEFETGRVAFQRLYVAAHGWARDAQGFRVESQLTADSKGKDGKADVWRASFASPSQRSVKPYIWSGTDAADAPSRGVSPGTEDTYSPSNSSTQVFDIGFLKVDTDKALETAQKHGGDKVLEKNPDTPVIYVLDWSGTTNELIWHVIYGTSRDDAKFRVAVNATSGDFIRVEK